jgi:hypothetical protein
LEVVTIDDMSLRLHGTGLPDREITFGGLEVLARALQLLALRIGRQLTGQDGAGRPTTTVSRSTEFRLRGTSAGSTVLSIGIGQDDMLDEGLEHQTLDRIFEVFVGISTGSPPTWTTASIGEATVGVIEALSANSTECELSSGTGRQASVRLRLDSASREVWAVEAPPELRAGVAVSGTLDLVDLRRRRFRIHDRAGNDVVLDDVANATEASRHVGTLVTATGDATLGSRSQVVSLLGAVVEATELPTWSQVPLAEALVGATAPPTGGIPGVDDDEVSGFLALIRE